MILSDADATDKAGRALAPHLQAGDIVALSGQVGSGKTSLVRGILAGLGFELEAPSPSYALVIPYAPPAVRLPAWHVDLYRLESVDDVEELGLDEALSDSVLLIEWAERLDDRLWPDALKIRLDEAERGGRRLTVKVPPSWKSRCPFQ